MGRIARATLLGALAAVAALPSAHAQKKIGVVIYSSDKQYTEARDAALGELKKQGFAAPAVQFFEENADGKKEKAATIATAVAAKKYDMVLVFGTTPAVALSKAIKDAPLVFAQVYDPVDSKIAGDWKSSGNNTTGTSTKISQARLVEALKRFKPVKTLGVLYTPGEKNSEQQLKDLSALQATYGVTVKPIVLAKKEDIEGSVKDGIAGCDAVYFTGAPLVSGNVPALTPLVAKAKAVSVTHQDHQVRAGVMLGVVPNGADLGRMAGDKAAKVLKGAAPASLPVEMHPSPDLVLNEKTAAATAGFALPEDMLRSFTRTIK